MLRPEQMSKVSVTGSRAVMREVIEAMHDLHLVDITDYDGSWEGFEPGDPLPESDETSSTLVTVRALKSTLGVEEKSAGVSPDLSNAEKRLEEIRTQVNDLDDRRDELRERLRDIDERRERMELFADLGLDLDLLWGYDTLDVMVGEGSPAAVREALAASDDIEGFEVFGGSRTVAAFGRTTEGATLSDTLVGVPFTAYKVPETEGDPAGVVAELEDERRQVEAELDRIESELEALRAEVGPFLLALEEQLSVEAQKYEAPLRFATTERAFIVEGWVPTDRYDEVESALSGAVDERIEVDEIERAQYTGSGHLHTETPDDGEERGAERAATDGGRATGSASTAGAASDDGDDSRVATDGGDVVTVDDDPPVVQRNSGITSPFEVLVKAVNRPKYTEFDPTMLVFLTFPFFFGFMIGDVGYGALYVLLGYVVYRKFDSDAVRDFGLVVVWLGIFTIIFGIMYGELFGLKVFGWLWGPLPSGGEEVLLPKGLTEVEWALTWIIAAIVFGWVQLNIGYILDFVHEYQVHGLKPAVIESGSWLLMLNGIWVFVFSQLGSGAKPSELVGEEAVFGSGEAATIPLGFTGFPELVGVLGIVAFFLGIGLLVVGPTYEVVEGLIPLVHVLSYTRLTAVLLSKGGMAVAANLLYFGAYLDDGFKFMHTTSPEDAPVEPEFDGLFNMGSEASALGLEFGIEGALLGIPVLIASHLVVLAIGGTAALQAVRLEYVEFFEKFYEGGGKNYQPFGYERTYTNTP